MIFKKVPNICWVKDEGHIAFMVVRSGITLLYPTFQIGSPDILIPQLKCILKPHIKDCLICFHEFVFEEKRVSCCHCQMPICKKCFRHYIIENPGWCPVCMQHLIFYGI